MMNILKVWMSKNLFHVLKSVFNSNLGYQDISDTKSTVTLKSPFNDGRKSCLTSKSEKKDSKM